MTGSAPQSLDLTMEKVTEWAERLEAENERLRTGRGPDPDLGPLREAIVAAAESSTAEGHALLPVRTGAAMRRLRRATETQAVLLRAIADGLVKLEESAGYAPDGSSLRPARTGTNRKL